MAIRLYFKQQQKKNKIIYKSLVVVRKACTNCQSINTQWTIKSIRKVDKNSLCLS